ncbi:potassium channel subfamily K member 15-like [Clytia hemisphaerica]|uniref:Uncharacterized protein n=1 Tax=Clytia hemisphaerica TaxID=252671 RepID=A0A7M5VCB6_9CNID
MSREHTNLLREATEKRRNMSVKCRSFCRTSCCRLKPETNLALMLCLVFYLYICLGGALFLLLEGQAETPDGTNIHKDRMQGLMDNLKIVLDRDNTKQITHYCEQSTGFQMRKKPAHENLWSFLESTDFAYQVVTGQGTIQSTRTIFTTGGKISYIIFLFLGIPLTVLTFRATGQRLNIMVYAFIRFINVKVFSRQLTANVHIKALILNIFIFIITILIGASMYCVTQGWSYLDSLFYTMSVSFTVSNSQENIVNQNIAMNSNKDKAYRILFNFYTFVAYTVLASLTWSAHHFTRHMRFKAQNRQLKNGDVHSTCPWVEVTRSKTASPSKSTRERETDRESVC